MAKDADASKSKQDPYVETEEWYPGMRQRSRPGSAPHEQVYDRVPLPGSSGRLVSSKPANKAFLRSAQAREDHRLKVEADAAKRAARPKKSGSTAASRSPSSSSSASSSPLRPLILLLMFLPLFSSFLTGTYDFNLSPMYRPPLRRWWRSTPLNVWRRPMKTFTPVQLARYDGSDPDRPVYVAVGGDVYDVSANRRIYGKGGSYNMMAGRDASRSFITGCFQTHLTHDLRGISDEDLKALDHWKSFFTDHAEYYPVGRVLLPPIDPDSPIPPPCRPAADADPAAGAQPPAPGETVHGNHPAPGPVQQTGRP